MVKLVTDAVDKSTYIVTAAFTDAAGSDVIPTAITWTLSNSSGTVVNSRSKVVVAGAASITIVLSGADLDYDDGPSRVLTIEAVYDSTEGIGLPLKDEAVFSIVDLVNA
jgi:uncharacterized lipoprotein YbaY